MWVRFAEGIAAYQSRRWFTSLSGIVVSGENLRIIKFMSRDL